MARWEPNARERLDKAAMELFGERGFDETSVSDIAERAGLTERTFFRHFSDKREVLFGGSDALRAFLVEKVTGAPAFLAPLDVVGAAIEATSAIFEERREFARQRHALITAHADLQERELIKLASLAASIAEALRRRGVTEPTASLASEAGIAVFKLAFERWVHDAKGRDLAQHVRESMSALKALAVGQASRVTGSSAASATGPSHRTRRSARRTSG